MNGFECAFRTEKGKNVAIKLYISSAGLDAKALLNISREHWSVGNKLHWQLDVSMNEDACRIRKNNSTENLATVWHTSLNLLKAKEQALNHLTLMEKMR